MVGLAEMAFNFRVGCVLHVRWPRPVHCLLPSKCWRLALRFSVAGHWNPDCVAELVLYRFVRRPIDPALPRAFLRPVPSRSSTGVMRDRSIISFRFAKYVRHIAASSTRNT